MIKKVVANTLDNYERFYTYLNELCLSYEKLMGLLAEKIDAVNAFDINKLEAVMKEEQVYVLLSKGFDNNINSYREKLSLRGQTLTEQIEELPDDQRPRFQELSQNLKSVLTTVSELNQKCQSLIEAKLHVLDSNVEELKKSNPKLYSKAADTKPGENAGPRMLMKSI